MHYISIPWKSHQYYQKSCFQQFCMLSETEERKKGVFYVYLDLYHFSFILPLSWSLKCSSGIISLQPEEFPLVLILDQFSWLQILLVCFHLNFFFFFLLHMNSYRIFSLAMCKGENATPPVFFLYLQYSIVLITLLTLGVWYFFFLLFINFFPNQIFFF